MTRLLVVTAIAFVVVAAAFVWMWRTYLPGPTLADIYLGMMPLGLRLLALVIVVMTGIEVAGGLKRNVGHARAVTFILLGLGVLGAVYGELNTRYGWLVDEVVNFRTLAPGRIQTLAVVALALFGAVLSLGVLHLKGGAPRD